jgi:hypothetical protein
MNAIPEHPMRLGFGEVAEVVSREGEAMLVQAGARRLAARRAASCLLEPEPGDTVLIGGDLARCYVLAVLERVADGPARLSIDGDVEIRARDGHLVLAAGKGVDVAARDAVTLQAETVSVKARNGRLFVDDLVAVGRTAMSHFGRVRAIGQALETVVDRILTRTKRSVRIAEESDHLRAGQIDLRASGTLHANGETTIVTAATLVKVDGGQIHLG